MAEALIKQFPYENYERFFRYIIKSFGIHTGKYAWQECIEASYSAYLYSIYRCAAENYDYVDNYVKKVGKIFIMSAIIISSADMRRSSWDTDFERKINKK